MDLFDELSLLGTDIDTALGRFMGNEQLLELMFKEIPVSIKKNGDIIQDIDSGDIEKAIHKSHTLKGNAGNLSIIPLFKAYKEITDLLREGKTEEAKEKILGIQELQQKISDTIEKCSQHS